MYIKKYQKKGRKRLKNGTLNILILFKRLHYSEHHADQRTHLVDKTQFDVKKIPCSKKKKKLTSNGAPNHYQCVVWNIKRITLEKVASKFALRVLWPVSSLANSLFLVLLPHNSPKMCTRACYSTQKGERGFYARRVKRRVVAHRSVSPLLHSGKTVFMLC